MQVLRALEQLASLPAPVHVALGVFDGVHLGHRRVIEATRDGTSVVVTFEPHPMRVLRPDKAPPLLTSTSHKLALLERLGVGAVLLLPFTEELANTAAETFLQQLAAPTHRVRKICVGARFHFGRQRAGNASLMRRLAEPLGYRVEEIPTVLTPDGEPISSSAIRQHVRHGRLDRAALMLGRPFSLFGTVEVGDRRGRELGFPTANLNPHNEVLPPDGVYAARVGPHRAVVNIGCRPTVSPVPSKRFVEVHLLDFEGDLYGQNLEVAFVQRIREERKFPSLEQLQAQIRADIAAARQLLA